MVRVSRPADSGSGADSSTSLLPRHFRRYQSDPAGTVTIGGVWYGLGCSRHDPVAGTFYAYTVPSIIIFMAVVPGLFAGGLRRTEFGPAAAATHPRFAGDGDFRSPGAVLFALLLFWPVGNEWSIAGWLPIFLIRRVGLSPRARSRFSRSTGSSFWRAAWWRSVLPRVRHGRLWSAVWLRRFSGA